MDSSQLFPIPRHHSSPIDGLTETFRIEAGESSRSKVTYLETFDWRLYKKGWLLAHRGDELALTRIKSGEELCRAMAPPGLRFLWDLEDGPLRNQLEPVIEMRAFLKRVSIQETETHYKVLNTDDKTVVRMVHTIVTGVELPDLLRVTAVRGYDEEMTALTAALEGQGLKRGRVKTSELFEAAGITPYDYRSKPVWHLNRDMRSDEAGRIIYSSLLEVMRWNIDGIRADIDTEYLHDFRVAVRRTRSGLGQIREIFDPETTLRAKTDFQYVGKLSNHMRDLDVYLLEQDTYREMLPPEVRDDIEIFFEYLREDRKREQKKLSRALVSDKVRDILQWWEEFLDSPRNQQGARSAMPIGVLADSVIWKRYKRICRDGGVLHPDSPDELYHELRIDCKKLRYLLGFFSSLYPAEDTRVLEASLKKLQNALGIFNDLSVQQLFLERTATSIKVSGSKVRRVVMVLGILAGILFERQRHIKQTCLSHIQNFIDLDTRNHFKTLCQSRQKL